MALRANIIILLSALAMSGCAVNRVEEVHTADDAHSIYKVPVVYGIGIAKDTPVSDASKMPPMEFTEYDPITKKGTAGICSGTKDTLVLSLYMGSNKFTQDHTMHYHVLMVPPGYYALSMGLLKPYEANPSVYIKVEQGHPQYLGDFWVNHLPSLLPKDHYHIFDKNFALPAEYHDDKAAEVLRTFEISTEQLQRITLMPTDGHASSGQCMITP